ncbi:MAG TPA: hypothetical protein VKN16_12170 [Methylomirabilota bacterium]|jgi:hypothetical protein|nr:hypothetical protein [Methylomirabilota bacterium]
MSRCCLPIVAAVVSVLAAGCASSLSTAIPAYPSAGQLEMDTLACEQTATGRAEFERRADYMACMIAQGYRTYVSAATYWAMAELTVSAPRKPSQGQVRLDLQSCATEAGAVAGARSGELAEAVDWVNAKVLRREPGRDGDALATAFARCLTKRAYATRPVSRVAAE